MSEPLHVFTDEQRSNLYFNVRALLKAKKLSQLDVQLDINVHFDSVRKVYKHRQHKCNMTTLRALAAYLGVTVDYLLNNHQ